MRCNPFAFLYMLQSSIHSLSALTSSCHSGNYLELQMKGKTEKTKMTVSDAETLFDEFTRRQLENHFYDEPNDFFFIN